MSQLPGRTVSRCFVILSTGGSRQEFSVVTSPVVLADLKRRCPGATLAASLTCGGRLPAGAFLADRQGSFDAAARGRYAGHPPDPSVLDRALGLGDRAFLADGASADAGLVQRPGHGGLLAEGLGGHDPLTAAD